MNMGMAGNQEIQEVRRCVYMGWGVYRCIRNTCPPSLLAGLRHRKPLHPWGWDGRNPEVWEGWKSALQGWGGELRFFLNSTRPSFLQQEQSFSLGFVFLFSCFLPTDSFLIRKAGYFSHGSALYCSDNTALGWLRMRSKISVKWYAINPQQNEFWSSAEVTSEFHVH